MGKKLLHLLLAVLLAASMTACAQETGNTDPQPDPTDQPEVTEDPIEEPEFSAPYTRVAGVATEGEFPVAVWVDFDPATDEVLKVTLTGYGNPVMMEAFGDQMEELNAAKEEYIGKGASTLSAEEDALSIAVAQAADSYLKTKDAFVIRPYQSLMTGRYMANNPYPTDIAALSEETVIETEIIAQYPSDAISLMTEDVMNGDKLTYPAGASVATVAKEDGTEAKISSQVIYANNPGIAIVAYHYNDLVLYDAVDIYENFTTELSGSDAYGKVVGIVNQTDTTVTYRVLGDKAMNFPGGTCGSTVIDVTIDTENNVIADVEVIEHSDSTYLANAWEYGGSYAHVGQFIYQINQFTEKFIGKDATTPITAFKLTSDENPEGGTPEEGGIDMVVTGATRTPNAIVYGVNAAIAEYSK